MPEFAYVAVRSRDKQLSICKMIRTRLSLHCVSNTCVCSKNNSTMRIVINGPVFDLREKKNISIYLRNSRWREARGHCANKNRSGELLNFVSRFFVLNRVDRAGLDYISFAFVGPMLTGELPSIVLRIESLLRLLIYIGTEDKKISVR